MVVKSSHPPRIHIQFCFQCWKLSQLTPILLFRPTTRVFRQERVRARQWNGSYQFSGADRGAADTEEIAAFEALVREISEPKHDDYYSNCVQIRYATCFLLQSQHSKYQN